MVGALRDSEEAELAPQRGVADIGMLAHSTGVGPRVEVDISGHVTDLPPPVEAGMYRLAQESITNAVRHSRHATRVLVTVIGDARTVRLTVDDDGLRLGGGPVAPGYGLVGMSERTKLLGGTLDPQPGIEVIGSARDGLEAVSMARKLRPDVCLFDIRMPIMDGIEATRVLAGSEVKDPLAVVVITTFDLDEYVHNALKAGAKGFLLKDAGPALLVQAIEAAACGDALIAPKITARLLRAFAASASGAADPVQPIDPITEREEEVLVHVARGRTNAEIAEDLFISLSTVKSHLGSLMLKLGARNRVEIAMWAYETDRV